MILLAIRLVLILIGFSVGDKLKAADVSSSWLIIQVSGLTAAGPTLDCTTPLTLTEFPEIDDQSVKVSVPDATTTVTCTNCTNGFRLQVSDKGSSTAAVSGSPGLWNSADEVLIGSADDSYSASSSLVAGTKGYGIQATTTSGNGILINPIYDRASSTSDWVGALTATSTWTTVASSSGDVSGQIIYITHKAAVSADTKGGSYSDVIYYNCFAP